MLFTAEQRPDSEQSNAARIITECKLIQVNLESC